MFTITKMSPGSEDYFLLLVYYARRKRRRRGRRGGGDSPDDPPDIDDDGSTAGFGDAKPYSIDLPGDPPGWWAGTGAAALELVGTIQEEPYRRTFRGEHPVTGQPLVQNAGSPNRRPGWEGCLSAPKDFSVLALGAPAEWRELLLQAHREVCEDVLQMIERQFAFSRVGKAEEGCRYVPVGLVAAMWEHVSSRALDEDLHVHLQLFNLGVDEHGHVRGIDPIAIFQNQKLITRYYHAKLAAVLKEKFGLVCDVKGTAFHIRDVPEELSKAKSKRRQQILARLEELGESGGEAAFRVARETRPAKDPMISWAELIRRWRADNAAAGFDDAYIINLLRHASCRPSIHKKNPSKDPAANPRADDSGRLPECQADSVLQPDNSLDVNLANASLPPVPDANATLQEYANYSSLVSNNPSEDDLANATDATVAPVQRVTDNSSSTTNSPVGDFTATPVLNAPSWPNPLRTNPKGSSKPTRRIIRQAVKRAIRRRNHFTARQLVFYTLYRLAKYAVDPKPVFEEVKNYLRAAPNIVPLRDSNGCERFTTRQILKEERRMLTALERISTRPGPRLSDRKLKRHLKKRPTLKPEQIDFIRHLTQSEGSFRIALGYAGVGKTFALKTAINACRGWFRRVYVIAPTGISVEELAATTGVECQTVTKFLGDFRLPLSAQILHHARQFWRAARGRRTWRFRQPRPTKITSRDIVLVDEAGMIGTRQMRLLAELVARRHATLWLVGDPSQLPAVEGTPPLDALRRRYGAPILREISRQKEDWAKEAAREAAEGRIGRALAMFVEHRQVIVRDDIDEVVRQACLDWSLEGLFTPQRALILANTNELAHKANEICQEHRLGAGCIHPSPSIRITDEQDEAVYKSRVYCGDRVCFTRNSQARPWGYDVKNGSRGTITEINFFTSEITVVLDTKKMVRVNVRDFPHIRLGYAVTTWKSQSTSTPKIYAIVGGNLQNFPASYVQTTRAIEETQLYTTSDLLNRYLENPGRSPLAKQMSRAPDLRLASEFLPNSPLDLRPRPPRLRQDPDQESDRSSATARPQGLSEEVPNRSEELQPRKQDRLPRRKAEEDPSGSAPPTSQGPGPSSPGAIGQPHESGSQAATAEVWDEFFRRQRLASLQRLIEERHARQRSRQRRHDRKSADSPTAPLQAASGLTPQMTTSPPISPSHSSSQPDSPFSTQAQQSALINSTTAAQSDPSNAKNGYQRLRMPVGTTVITNGSVLSASCVDGGLQQFRNRPPPPMGCPMTFATPEIRVQRITPVPTRMLTLEEATRAGLFSLVGTGCADNVRVRCQPGESWVVHVNDPVALISPQDDIAAARQHYNRPYVVAQLTRLDRLNQDLNALIPRRCFLTSLFACARREISWLLPIAPEAAYVTYDHLNHLCRLLFEDPRARQILDYYAQLLRPADEAVVLYSLQESMSTTPYPPSREALQSLAKALAEETPEQPALIQCMASMASRIPDATSQERLRPSIDALATVVANAKIRLHEHRPSPEQIQAVVTMLYRANDRTPPAGYHVPQVLTHICGLDHNWLEAFPPARFVYNYITAYLRGEQDRVNRLHADFLSAMPKQGHSP